MKKLKDIAHVYLLNLETNIQKKANALHQLKTIGIHEVEVVKATHYSEMDIPINELESSVIHIGNRFNAGSYAARLNFLEILSDAITKNFGFILFVEDDVHFDCTRKEIEECLGHLPPDFDIFNLGPYHFQRPETYSENLVKVNGAWLFHAAIMSQSGIKKAHELISNALRPPDLTMGMVKFLENNMQYYAPLFTLAYQKGFVSDISGNIEDKNVPKYAFDCKEIETIEMILAK